MEENTGIGHFTVAKNLDLLHLKAHATIGRGNWITGFPLGDSLHFASETERRPELVVGEHSAITHRHLLDCTNAITIGRFTTVAGFQSQFISHTIDIAQNRQVSHPISVGDYCFVGSNSVLLGGSALPEIAPEQRVHPHASSLRWRARAGAQRSISRVRLFQPPPGFRHLN
jgi:acetyltransferase-like isoleucine patch superfamily enzyme